MALAVAIGLGLVGPGLGLVGPGLATGCGKGEPRPAQRTDDDAAGARADSATAGVSHGASTRGPASPAPRVGSTPAAPPRRRPPASLTPAQKRAYRDALRRGRAADKRGDHAAAVTAFGQALAAAPADPRADSELGWAAFRAGDLPRALRATQESIAGTTEPAVRAASLYNLGRIFEAQKQPGPAADAYRQSLSLRENPTVRARLVALVPATPAGEPLAPAALDGPFARLVDWCKASVQGPDEPCDPDGGRVFAAETRTLAGSGRWRELRIFRAGYDEACALAVRTPAGWFATRAIVECREMGGRWDRDVSAEDLRFRDLVAGGDLELTLRFASDMTRNVTDWVAADDVGDDFMVLEQTHEVWLVVCGLGRTGAPSCLPAALIQQDESFSVEPDDAPVKRTLKPQSFRLTARFQDGALILAPAPGSKVDRQVSPLIGAHRLDF